MKKISLLSTMCAIIMCASSTVSAQNMNMYVNNQYVVRDVQSIAGFDMLPVLDIAGELGVGVSFDGNTLVMTQGNSSYTFQIGNAAVYDNKGVMYGLDVVPQIINGRLMIPAKFFQDVFHMNYGWDWVTNSIFLNSDGAYQWLITTGDYKLAKENKFINMVRKEYYTRQAERDYNMYYTCVEKKDYYEVVSKVTRLADGGTLFHVSKSTHRITEIGSGSELLFNYDYAMWRHYSSL